MPELKDRLAARQDIDAPLAPAWSLIVQAADMGFLRASELDELMEQLEGDGDWGSDELTFDVMDGELRVRLHDLEAWCNPKDMLAALARVAKESM